MKAKSLEIEAYTIAETTRKLGYKSSKTIYRLLNKTPSPLEEYKKLLAEGWKKTSIFNSYF